MDTLTIDNPQLRTVMELSDEGHWFCRIVGKGGMIDQPVFKEPMWYDKLDESDSSLPADTRQMIQAIKRRIPEAQFIIGHETPPLLGSGEPPKPKRTFKLTIPWGKVAKTLAIAAGVAAAPFIFFQAVMILVVAIIPALFVVGALILGASLLLFDPVVICVLPDGTWVEVDSWLD